MNSRLLSGLVILLVTRHHLLAATPTSGPGFCLEAPAGWRFPVESDYRADWQDFRENIPIPFFLVADLNGDGIPDEAWILLRTEVPGWGIFVWLSAGKDHYELIKVEDHTTEDSAQSVCITLSKAGTYLTACGKGYWDCSPGEPEKVTVKVPTICLDYYERATFLLIWDQVRGGFKAIQMSD